MTPSPRLWLAPRSEQGEPDSRKLRDSPSRGGSGGAKFLDPDRCGEESPEGLPHSSGEPLIGSLERDSPIPTGRTGEAAGRPGDSDKPATRGVITADTKVAVYREVTKVLSEAIELAGEDPRSERCQKLLERMTKEELPSLICELICKSFEETITDPCNLTDQEKKDVHSCLKVVGEYRSIFINMDDKIRAGRHVQAHYVRPDYVPRRQNGEEERFDPKPQAAANATGRRGVQGVGRPACRLPPTFPPKRTSIGPRKVCEIV